MTEHSPSGSRYNKLLGAGLTLLIGASALSGCGGEKAAAQSDRPESTPDTTTSAPANPTQPESTGIIPEKICYTDPATGEQTTQDNAVKMDTAAIEASSVYSEGECPAAEIIPMGFEVNYDDFVGWESKNEVEKELTREFTYKNSGKVTIFNEQLVEGQIVLGELGGGDGVWQFKAEEWVKYWGERVAVVNAIRNDKSDPRNEEVAYKMAEGLIVPGTNEANFILKDLWSSERLRKEKTFLQFDPLSMRVTGQGKPYTMEDGTIIYPIQIEATATSEEDATAENGKEKIIMAFSPIQYKDDSARKYTETIKLYHSWTKGVNQMPDHIKIIEQ